MIRAIDFQKIDMSDEEYTYYTELIKKFSDDAHKGSDFFHNLFLTDENGCITIIKPTKPIPWDVIFFIQNLMINQQLRGFDNRLKEIEATINGKK